jgi:hypothetical protein
MRLLISVLCSLMIVACGGGGGSSNSNINNGSSNGTDPQSAKPCPVPSGALEGGSISNSSGVVLNALTCAPVAGVKVSVNVLGEVTTGSDGSFKFSGVLPATQYAISLTSPSTVTRNTFSTLDGATRVFSLIPNSFDLRAFEEIARPSSLGLLRWSQAPILILQKQVIDMSTGMTDTTIPVELTNGGVADKSYLATSATLSDDFLAGAIERLRTALPQLTAYPAFKDVRIEAAVPGSRVSGFLRNGAIVVAWVTNITNKGAAGMGLSSGYWYYRNDASRIPAVLAGAVFVDNGYSADSAILVHEFGHTLGYQHTDLAPSFMNRLNPPLPTEFDLQAAKIAYDRSPGNKWPDVDHSP